ncbi:spore coat associated protein CotJA [Paenibacillus pini]|uniref:spore coat associated protein CotJA n=1 Tax=Paenibacillus pini TaxID=669461 RepID=UPI00055F81ED
MSQVRVYKPFIGPFDPCPPQYYKTYVVPPNQYLVFQPLDWPQYSLPEALKLGTLWPNLYSPYTPTGKRTEEAKSGE